MSRLNWDVHRVLEIEHIFSCEVEPFKQAYIERNIHPPVLFRDIRELGRNRAYTAYGALVPVPHSPGCVDILIAGTSCVDYSGLNNQKVRANYHMNVPLLLSAVKAHALFCYDFFQSYLSVVESN
jgi:site-specific DNA-cytosine methylase